MNTKEITYKIKNTSATTDYMSVSSEDMSWIKEDLLMAYKNLLIDLAKNRDKEIREIYDVLNSPDKNLPKRRAGMGYAKNSLVSFIDGMIDNIVRGTQRDLTIKQADGLAYVSEIINYIQPDLPQVTFAGPRPKSLKAPASPDLPRETPRVIAPHARGNQMIFGNGLFEL
jgi:hypothetical protein